MQKQTSPITENPAIAGFLLGDYRPTRHSQSYREWREHPTKAVILTSHLASTIS